MNYKKDEINLGRLPINSSSLECPLFEKVCRFLLQKALSSERLEEQYGVICAFGGEDCWEKKRLVIERKQEGVSQEN